MKRYNILFILVLISLLVGACSSTISTENQGSEGVTNVTKQAPQTTPSIAMATSEVEAKTPTTQPAIATATSIAPTNTQDFNPLKGNLFLVDQIGVLRVSLEHEEQDYILKKENDWLEWKASFSNAGELLAYLVQDENTIELWVSELKIWLPELVFSVGNEYDVVSLEWLLNDQYLLLRLGNLQERSVGKKVQIEKSYIINASNGKIVSPENWSGNCNTIAFTPKTNNLAIWCSETAKANEGQEFIVIEKNGEIWFTRERPTEIINEVKFDGATAWSWSSQREFIAFTTYNNDGDSLFYMPTNNKASVLLANASTGPYSSLTWSPNSQYLAYFGKCTDGHFCQVIIDVATKDVIWNNQMSLIEPANHISWSPDSRFIAVWALDEIIIVDIMSGQTITVLQDISIIDAFWIFD